MLFYSPLYNGATIHYTSCSALRPTGSIIMAIAYLQLKIVSRGNAKQNRNCVGASAYNSREKMYSIDNGHTYNYSYKSADIENKNVLLPEYAPKIYKDRQTLWQAVEKVETSSKAQLARKIILALPWNITAEERKQLVENFCKKAFVKNGMCVDYAIHKPDKGNKNYHVHIMLTMRSIDEHGQWLSKKRRVAVLDKNGNKIEIDKSKNRTDRNKYVTKTVKTNDWDNPKNLEKWRNLAEQEINKYLPKENQISMKSYQRQGLDKLAQVHEGYSQNSPKKELNEKIKLINSVNQDIDNELKTWKAAEIKIQNEKITENENNWLSKSPTDERKDTGTMSDTHEKSQVPQAKQETKEKQDTAHKQKPDKWELHKQYNNVTEKLKQLAEKKEQLIKEAKEAGKKKCFWQKEKVVFNCYLLEHGYKDLKKEIQELEKQQAELDKKIWGDRQIAEQQLQKKENVAEHLKEQIKTVQKKKPKAKLVKSERQIKKEKERICGKDGWRMQR